MSRLWQNKQTNKQTIRRKNESFSLPLLVAANPFPTIGFMAVLPLIINNARSSRNNAPEIALLCATVVVLCRVRGYIPHQVRTHSHSSQYAKFGTNHRPFLTVKMAIVVRPVCPYRMMDATRNSHCTNEDGTNLELVYLCG